jgi:hypothetical protein
VFIKGASSSTKERSMFLCVRYTCCAVASARVCPRCHGVQIAIDSVHLLSRTVLSHIYTKYARFHVNAGLCSRLCLNLRSNYFETAVSQLKSRRPDRRKDYDL